MESMHFGIARFPEAPAIERAKAYLYQAELAVRTGDSNLAVSSLAALKSLKLTDTEQDMIAEELSHVTVLIGDENR